MKQVDYFMIISSEIQVKNAYYDEKNVKKKPIKLVINVLDTLYNKHLK
jgi:hypothetical protein